MMRRGIGILCALILAVLCSLEAAEKPLVQRGRIDGRDFSEVGRLYVDDDKLIHFRTDQRLYYFSHMYYIWDALAKAGVIEEGKIVDHNPIRITGNYSKAAAVYDFGEEPALRGSQIVWIDRVEKGEIGDETQTVMESLFDGKSFDGWEISPASSLDAPTWEIKDGVLSASAPSDGVSAKLIGRSSYTDFELTFEYRSSWGNSASLVLRSNEKGEGIALSLDHIDEGTIGLPKSATVASRPFALFETREKRGVGATTHYHVHYDGRLNYDAVTRDKFLECASLNEFLKEWDGAGWNLVRVRCVGAEPEVTVWISGFLVRKFKPSTVVLREKNPVHIGAIENRAVHSEGRVGFVVHSMLDSESEFLLRELRVLEE